MAKDIALVMQLKDNCIIEAEFYSPEMNFAEIMHFFRSEDVTSAKNVTKYKKLWEKTKEGTLPGWEFPGRDWAWLTTWHDSLKFYAFSFIDLDNDDYTFERRYSALKGAFRSYSEKMDGLRNDLVVIPQESFETLDELYQAYDQAIVSGTEGLVIVRKDTLYKTGRYSLNANTAFKLKDDDHIWDGQILAVEEGTVAREGSEKTVNELGRSRTSQLQEDRVPSGVAKGFLVVMDDGQTLTVSLNGYNQEEKKDLFANPAGYIGKWIRFKGMLPVKEGGLPRHARFTRGNIRDDK
jgi:hypothetical protein